MLRSDGLKGAIVYYDGQMNDTRMGLMIALTATQHGANIANRVKVRSRGIHSYVVILVLISAFSVGDGIDQGSRWASGRSEGERDTLEGANSEESIYLRFD